MFGFGKKKKIESKKTVATQRKTAPRKNVATTNRTTKTIAKIKTKTVYKPAKKITVKPSIKSTVTRTVESTKPKRALGNVYWANSQKIDASDQKPRRPYVVTRDNGKTVGVAKIRGYNNNPKNEKRLAEIDQEKYKLKKRCGVDKKVYTRRADTKQLLSLKDKQVFDEKPAFKLNNRDRRRVIRHTSKNKKGGSR